MKAIDSSNMSTKIWVNKCFSEFSPNDDLFFQNAETLVLWGAFFAKFGILKFVKKLLGSALSLSME
jgi:hypothetical protein